MVTQVTPITTALSGEASDHTIQAFIELVYVQTANDILVSHMASLENSLGITQRSMDLLTQVQNLHNAVKIEERGDFPYGQNSDMHFGGGADIYRPAATAHFAHPLKVSADFSGISGGSAAFVTQMATLKQRISAMIASLSAITPLISGQPDSNSLLAKLKLVLKDINDTNAAVNVTGAKNWLIDHYNDSTTTTSNAGKYQQRITDAITAGQSLNTTQTESVRNFLYLYEEYYKSASAVLTAISQMIQKMAGGIAR